MGLHTIQAVGMRNTSSCRNQGDVKMWASLSVPHCPVTMCLLEDSASSWIANVTTSALERFQAGVGALLVAAKQLCGEQARLLHVVMAPLSLGSQELGPIRAKHLASVYFLGCAVVSLFFSATFGTLGMIGTWFG